MLKAILFIAGPFILAMFANAFIDKLWPKSAREDEDYAKPSRAAREKKARNHGEQADALAREEARREERDDSFDAQPSHAASAATAEHA